MQSRPMLAQNIPTPAQTNLLVFKDYIPLLQTLVWPVFWLIVILVFQEQVTKLLHLVIEQIQKGGTVEIGGVKVGGAKFVEKTSDLGDEVETAGNPDRFELLFKAQGKSQGSSFKKSTKAMKVPGGCVIQVTNERQNRDDSWSVAESLTFVPGEVTIKDDIGSGRFLDKLEQVVESE